MPEDQIPGGGRAEDGGLAFQDLVCPPRQPSLFSLTDAEPGLWFELDISPCFELSPDGKLRRLNPAAERLVSSGRLLSVKGQTLDFFCERSRHAVRRALSAVGKQGQRRRELLYGGEQDWFAVELVRAEDGGSIFLSVRGSSEPAPRISTAFTEAFGLTRAETVVLERLMEDAAPKEIARRLSISPATIRAHLRSIYAKLNTQGLTGTVSFVCRVAV